MTSHHYGSHDRSSTTPAGLKLGRRVIHQLRASLERDTGIQAATYLQEAGFAGGEELYRDFAAWLKRTRRVDQPADLDMRYPRRRSWRVLRRAGLGHAERDAAGHPQCWRSTPPTGPRRWTGGQGRVPVVPSHLRAPGGLLRPGVAGSVAVMEVECRSRGDARCRFLAGAPETLGMLYDRMAQGSGYLEALSGKSKAPQRHKGHRGLPGQLSPRHRESNCASVVDVFKFRPA